MANIDDIEILFRQNYLRMHRLASAILHDSDGAHDIVHDVFAAILDNRNNAVPETAYLLASVKNRCLNRLKSIDVRERFQQLYLIQNEDDDFTEDWPDEEVLTLIEEAEKDMPPKCREIFCLRFHKGLSAADIAKMTGTGERSVYKHLRNAINLLKIRLNG